MIDYPFPKYTVDEIIDSTFPGRKNKPEYTLQTDVNICDHIVTYKSEDLLTILQSKSNVPSEFDLIIINSISEIIKVLMHSDAFEDTVRVERYKRMLEIYKYRKV